MGIASSPPTLSDIRPRLPSALLEAIFDKGTQLYRGVGRLFPMRYEYSFYSGEELCCDSRRHQLSPLLQQIPSSDSGGI
jgi:hypothetical protein